MKNKMIFYEIFLDIISHKFSIILIIFTICNFSVFLPLLLFLIYVFCELYLYRFIPFYYW